MHGHIDKETPSTPEGSAFEFKGNWAAFGKIALTNLLLTFVTLGIYRFWATTRERKYLWGETRFIDDRLEWTGTGMELFIGFIMAMVLVFIPLFGIQFLQQALILQGQMGAAGLLTLVLVLLMFYLIGIARFRALRYRLSRTYWHGIRGGSDNQGFGYGWSYIWKSFVGGLALYLLVPWSMMSLWNERWGKMSFGPHGFHAIGDHSDTFKRFLLFYLLPIVGLILGFVISDTGNFGVAGLVFIAIYLGLGVVAIAFYAKFFRVAIDGLSLQDLDFGFSAKTKDWFLLLLGDIGLWLLAFVAVALPLSALAAAIGFTNNFDFSTFESNPDAAIQAIIVPVIIFALIPFALVGPFIRYRHWKFFITYMQCYGEVNLDSLTQSETETSKHGEGLLDAFDVGAI
jgi:uncharacterized membrane protein YjgN (DUF898 family)